ncbi:MAG: adenosylmethionine--8-amino-7-oxononanoate transaminase [Bdellovibrionota bacterium]|nr:adenosylmethionine--8-amino-7-oxononanoate transaminase [Bdellovibrionota bacterium]
MTLLNLDKELIWHPYTQEKLSPESLLIEKAKGPYLYTKDGRKIFDAISSWWVNLHGHCHPYIQEKIKDQMENFEQILLAGHTHEKAITLAEKLLKKLPQDFKKVFYSDNGSTAVETALKMALQYWHNKGENKNRILAFRNGYHGETFGAMSVSGLEAQKTPFLSHLFKTDFIQPPLKGRLDAVNKSIQDLKNEIEKGKDIAAFIYEPMIQGAGGMLVHEAQGLNELIKICKENGILCIADEVMTGFGRTGKLFGSDHMEEKPHIICLAKGLTGGTLPLAVTACTQELYEAFLSEDKNKALLHGHSYSGNALGCASAIANLELLDRPETINQIENIENLNRQFKEKIEKSHHYLKTVQEIRHQGTVIAIELKTDEKSGYFNQAAKKIGQYFLKENILIRPLGNVIYLVPPYSSPTDEMKCTFKCIEDFLEVL